MKQFSRIVLGTSWYIQIHFVWSSSKKEPQALSISILRNSNKLPTICIKIPTSTMVMHHFASISSYKILHPAYLPVLKLPKIINICSKLAMRPEHKNNCQSWRDISQKNQSNLRKQNISIWFYTVNNKFKNKMKRWEK